MVLGGGGAPLSGLSQAFQGPPLPQGRAAIPPLTVIAAAPTLPAPPAFPDPRFDGLNEGFPPAEAWGGPRSLFPEMVGPGLQRVAPDPIHGGLTRHVLWQDLELGGLAPAEIADRMWSLARTQWPFRSMRWEAWRAFAQPHVERLCGVLTAAAPGLSASEACKVLDALAIAAAQDRWLGQHVRAIAVVPALAGPLASPEAMASLSPGQVSRVMWAVGKLEVAEPALLHAVSATLRQRSLDLLSPEHLATILCGLARIRSTDQALLQAIVTHVEQPWVVGAFRARPIANALWAFATLRIRRVSLLRAMAGRIQAPEVRGTFREVELAIVAWALASLRYQDLEAMAVLGDDAVPVVHLFRPQSLANLVWAFGSLQVRHRPLEEAARTRLATPGFLAGCTGQNVANLVWALATLRATSPDVMRAVAGRVLDPGFLPRLRPQGVASVAWAFGKTRVRHLALMRALGDRVLAKDFLTYCSPQGVCNMAWAWARLRVRNATVLDALAARALRSGQPPLDGFSPQGVAGLLWAFAKLQLPNPALVDAVVARALEPGALAAFKSQELGILVWSAAELQVADNAFWDAITERLAARGGLSRVPFGTFVPLATALLRRSGGVDPVLLPLLLARAQSRPELRRAPGRQIANLAVALASAGVRDTALFGVLAYVAARPGGLATFRPSDVARVAGAFATVGLRDAGLFQVFADHLLRPEVLQWCSPAAAAEAAWAFSALGLANRPLVHRMGTVVANRTANATAKDFARATWAVASSGVRHAALFRAAVQFLMIPGNLEGLDATGAAFLAWAFAETSVPGSGKLLYLLAGYLVEHKLVAGMTPHEVAMTAWAYGALDVNHPPLMATIAHMAAAPDGLRGLAPPAISGLLWAFARLGIFDDALLVAVAGRLLRGGFVASFDPPSLASLLWSFATLGSMPPALLEAVGTHIATDHYAMYFSAGDAVRAAWALAALDVRTDAPVAAVVERLRDLERRLLRMGCPPELHLFFVHIQYNQILLPYANMLLAAIPNLVIEARTVHATQSHSMPPSPYTGLVARALKELRIPFQEVTVPSDGGGYRVDFLLLNARVVVEIENLTAFLLSRRGLRLSGAALLKHRQLQEAGYRVVSVPYHEIVRLGTLEARIQYLRRRLRGAREGT